MFFSFLPPEVMSHRLSWLSDRPVALTEEWEMSGYILGCQSLGGKTAAGI